MWRRLTLPISICQAVQRPVAVNLSVLPAPGDTRGIPLVIHVESIDELR